MQRTSPHLIVGGMQHRALLNGNDLSYFFGFFIATVHLEGFPPAYHCTWCTPLKKNIPTLNKVTQKGMTNTRPCSAATLYTQQC